MPDKSTHERMERYIQNQKARGQVKVCVWVPAEQAGYIRGLAERMREYMKDNPNNPVVGDPANIR